MATTRKRKPEAAAESGACAHSRREKRPVVFEKEAKSAVFVTNPNATPRIARTSVFNSYRVGCLDCAETWGPKEAKVQFGSEF